MSKRKGKKYVQKHIVTPAMRSSPTQSMQTELKLMAYQALDAILLGRGDHNMFSCLSAVVNLTTVLAEKGKGKEYLDYCKAGLDAVRRIGERGAKTGRFGIDGDGYKVLKDCLDLHGQQIEVCTRLQISDAIFEIESRLRRQEKQDAARNKQIENIA